MKTKKILQSIVLVLLLLAISSNLLASSYSRTAGGSWDDWGWSADWIPPFSFPIAQAIALGLGGGAFQTSKALYESGNILRAQRALLGELLSNRGMALDRIRRSLRVWGIHELGWMQTLRNINEKIAWLIPNIELETILHKLLLRDTILSWSGAIFGEVLANVLSISTPNILSLIHI